MFMCVDVLVKVSEIILVLVSLTLVMNEPIRVSEVCFLASALLASVCLKISALFFFPRSLLEA